MSGQLMNARADVEKMESVELIAAGYEWICPAEDCDNINHEIEVTEVVECRECHRLYQTSDYHHAIG